MSDGGGNKTTTDHHRPLRLLNLVLYSPSVYYDEMREALRAHHARNCRGAGPDAVVVRHLFYWYDESLLAPFELRGADELVLRGREAFLPGILHKTVRAIELATSGALGADCAEADFVVRTNVSSVCDFQGIARALRACGAVVDDDDDAGVFYGGPSVIALNWRHNEGGITDDRLKGMVFVQGTCIALSRAACRALVRGQRSIDWTVIDDVAIGEFFRDCGVRPRQLDDGAQVFSTGVLVAPGRTLVYRHATHHAQGEDSRMAYDVPNMRAIVAAWPKCEAQQQLLSPPIDDDDVHCSRRRRLCCCCRRGGAEAGACC